MIFLNLISLVKADNPDCAPTFYFRTGAQANGCPAVPTFNDGNRYGPCNGGVHYGPQSKYWVAIAGGGSRCGQSITMTYQGRSINLVVMDECPGCHGDNHVDMSLDALIELTGSVEAACAIHRMPARVSWRFGGGQPAARQIVDQPAPQPAAQHFVAPAAPQPATQSAPPPAPLEVKEPSAPPAVHSPNVTSTSTDSPSESEEEESNAEEDKGSDYGSNRALILGSNILPVSSAIGSYISIAFISFLLQ
jgi:hypothetical protein